MFFFKSQYFYSIFMYVIKSIEKIMSFYLQACSLWLFFMGKGNTHGNTYLDLGPFTEHDTLDGVCNNHFEGLGYPYWRTNLIPTKYLPESLLVRDRCGQNGCQNGCQYGCQQIENYPYELLIMRYCA